MKLFLFCLCFAIALFVNNEAKSQSIKPSDTVFVELRTVIPDIVLDVKYAREDNFTGMVLYPSAKVFLRKIVADSLESVQNYLKTKNLQLKVFDGYRPVSVQKRMWELLPDPRYVADPRIGSKHNRGTAVDVTIIDELGNELDMGTPFDDFTEKAAPDYPDLSDEVKENRRILIDAMKRSGFNVLDTEWWHFDFYLWEKFSLCDFVIE